MNAERKRLRQADYLQHMLDAIRLARSYVEGLSREDFLADKKTQQAVILNIVVIGEAAAQLAVACPAFVDQKPELPWKQMRGMRNRMAHGYFEINMDIVWDTVQDVFPDLERQIAAIDGTDA
ncbi:MAG: DUF86 domain-containing protein [Betaproteobacteria bacterium]